MLKNKQLQAYLNLKGLTTNDLFSNHAIIMDDDRFILSERGEAWLNTPVVVDTETNKVIIAKDILNKKQFQYLNDGCIAAIFIPLFNLTGKFVGYSIRKMCDTSKHDSWFVPGERKIDLIYNLNNAFDSAIKKKSIILTEGVYDTIALVKYGFTNAGALLGTNLSNIQFFQLFSLVDNIALCLDNDQAGQNAVEKIVREYKDKVTFWKVNIDKDPDEFLKENGKDLFKTRLVRYSAAVSN